MSYAGRDYRIVIGPALQAGQPGWTSAIAYGGAGGGGGGGGYPTARWPFVGTTFSVYGGGQVPAGDAVDYSVTGPSVAAVRFGTHTIGTFTSPNLPVGDRAAVFFVPASFPAVIPFPGLRLPGRSIRLVALDRSGHVIRTHFVGYPTYRSTFWQSPSAGGPRYGGPHHPLAGACELSERGLAALTPEFGHVIKQIRPVRNATGEVFLSCIDTTYYLHGWSLEAAVLIDAARPGTTLGPIPGAHRVTGHPWSVNVPAGPFPGALTARRFGQAWLVVGGGASLAQRPRVLAALEIRRLTLP